jgi:hypothetical protein
VARSGLHMPRNSLPQQQIQQPTASIFRLVRKAVAAT